ncbi:hypothetical protein DFH08DRAFT_804406 [Mycena albidolilacea]|uniref:Uncharacterized protein n=1 Tax=Mycena albidolilacea TaxID=1033008 RepID=A0AAD7ABZ5_9AGAR|nr:hypothetical protein DFH08DRAFT_804406 [Mycena albidolilacea]
MSILPNAGMAAPVPDTFNFSVQTTVPPPKDLTGRSLRMRNQHNVTTEKFNEDDMADMIGSEIYCRDVGPLPVFICQQVEHLWRKRAENTEADKVDKERTKGRVLQGAMIFSTPIVGVAGQAATVLMPNVVLQSMLDKLYVPLHWFTDDHLHFIQHRLHKVIQPEDALNTEKVVVFDMLKMPGWGSDKSSTCLSPLKWQQAAKNLHVGLVTLSEDVSTNPTKANFGAEFGKHQGFFLVYPKFEENYVDWYDFEREARHEILQGFLFNGDYYSCQVDGRLYAKQAVALHHTTSYNLKCSWEHNLETPSQHLKAPRQSTSNSPLSFQGDISSPQEESSSFRNGFGSGCGPMCIVCDGTHRLKHHPAAVTSFPDGVACFALPCHGGELWTVKPFKGPRSKHICVELNLPNGCS